MSTQPVKILLIDDNLENLQLLASLLEIKGYTIRRTTSGRMALKYAQLQLPDLILLDINMPNMNGFEVCQQLKSLTATSEIPVVFVSAMDRTQDKVKAFEIGAADYITKPFREEEVLMRVRNQLTIQNQKRQLLQKNQDLEKEISKRQEAEAKINQLNSDLQQLVKERTESLLEALKFQENLSEAQSIAHLGNWEFDVINNKLTWSKEVFSIFGRNPILGEPEYREKLAYYHPDDSLILDKTLKNAIATGNSYILKLRLMRADSKMRYVEIRGRACLNSQGKVVSLIGTLQDISEQKQLEEALRLRLERERLFRAITGLIRASLDLNQVLTNTVVEVRRFLKADRTLIYRLCTADKKSYVMTESDAPNITALNGRMLPDNAFLLSNYHVYEQGEVSNIPDVTQQNMPPSVLASLEELSIKSKLVVPIVTNSRMEPKPKLWGLLIAQQCYQQRQWSLEEIDLLKQLTTQVAIAIQQSELYQELQKVNQSLERLATTDSLTQLNNRRSFDQSLQREWERLAQEQRNLTLVLCDIDCFKQYNDRYGHLAGDDCLVLVAGAICSQVKRYTNMIARYGGEEFAIILPHTQMLEVIRIVEAIQQELMILNIAHKDSTVVDYVTLSFGIAHLVPIKGAEPQLLIDRADQALYKAKAAGRNCYAIYDD